MEQSKKNSIMAFPLLSHDLRLLLLKLRLYPRHCEPTGRREAPPDDRLREAIHTSHTARKAGLLRRFAPRNDGCCHFFPTISFAFCPNMFLRASSSKGSLTNLPIASPACTCGRARTSAYQRLMFG